MNSKNKVKILNYCEQKTMPKTKEEEENDGRGKIPFVMTSIGDKNDLMSDEVSLEDHIEKDRDCNDTIDDYWSDEMDLESRVQGITEQTAEEQEKKKKIWWIITILLIATVILLPINLQKEHHDKNDENSDAVPGDAVPGEEELSSSSLLLATLEPYTLQATLLDASTPQGQAFQQLLSEVEESSLDISNGFRIKQRYGLMCVYFSTRGENWITNVGWNNFTQDECTWFGVLNCETLYLGTHLGTNQAVVELNLEGNNLQGSLPFEICALSPTFESLQLGNNGISGAIPWCMAGFRFLKKLELFNLQLTGEAQGLLTLPYLKQLWLDNNYLSGSLDSLFVLPEKLAADLVGGFEDSTALSREVRSVRLDWNAFQGTVPSLFGELDGLKSLILYSNKLSGDIPSEICALTDVELEHLGVDCAGDSPEVSCTCCSYCG